MASIWDKKGTSKSGQQSPLAKLMVSVKSIRLELYQNVKDETKTKKKKEKKKMRWNWNIA